MLHFLSMGLEVRATDMLAAPRQEKIEDFLNNMLEAVKKAEEAGESEQAGAAETGATAAAATPTDGGRKFNAVSTEVNAAPDEESGGHLPKRFAAEISRLHALNETLSEGSSLFSFGWLRVNSKPLAKVCALLFRWSQRVHVTDLLCRTCRRGATSVSLR